MNRSLVSLLLAIALAGATHAADQVPLHIDLP